MLVVSLFALGFLGISLLMLAKPEVYYRYAMRYVHWRWMAPTEAASRAGLGVLLLLDAESAAYPDIVRLLGGMLVLIGFALALVPWAQHRRFGVWVIDRIRPWLRPSGGFGIILALLLFYAGLGNPFN